MNINWLVRFKNPIFIIQLSLSILLPILSYMGLTVEDLTTWQKLGSVLLSAISNPYVIGLTIVSVLNAINDPTTKGICDNKETLNITELKK